MELCSFFLPDSTNAPDLSLASQRTTSHPDPGSCFGMVNDLSSGVEWLLRLQGIAYNKKCNGEQDCAARMKMTHADEVFLGNIRVPTRSSGYHKLMWFFDLLPLNAVLQACVFAKGKCSAQPKIPAVLRASGRAWAMAICAYVGLIAAEAADLLG